MPAFSAFLAHFYAVVRHVDVLHWFRAAHAAGAAGTRGVRDVAAARDMFFADLSHELKTPIAIMKINTEILAGLRGGDRKAALAAMGSTTDRMSRLVDGFIASARLDMPGKDLRIEEFAPADLLSEVREDFIALAEEKGVELLIYGGTAARIAADREKLRRVVINLASNALKHTGRGGEIRLASRIVADGGERNMEISVEDTGSGIAADELPRIFERFYRIAGDGTEGSGIGLHLCKKIVEAHGGMIVAESRPGEGSRFAIILPLAAPLTRMGAASGGAAGGTAGARWPLPSGGRFCYNAEYSPNARDIASDEIIQEKGSS